MVSPAATPLVSCIMPTRNRRQFVGQAIWYFLRQEYPARELVIIDDGEDAIADLVPADPMIRYVRLGSRTVLGEKRNIACEISRGEFIAHWDDDDWMAPHRLGEQVAELLEYGGDACVARDLLHYRLFEGSAWLSHPPDDNPAWLAGSTLLFRRDVWDHAPFPAISRGEDTAFLEAVPRHRLRVLPEAPFYVAVLHRGNMVRRNLNEPRWRPVPLATLETRLGPDFRFYATLRHGFRPPSRSASPQSVTVAAGFVVYDGYGSMAEYLALGMARAGATVNLAPFRIDRQGLSHEFLDLLRRSRPEPGAPVLSLSWWGEDLGRHRRAADLFINTMWETSRLPRDWPARLNAARAVVVPARQVARVFRDSGVTAPLEVVPQGIDPGVYRYVDRPTDRGLTTLMVGVLVERKNVQEGIAAWKMAFAGDPGARLIIKARFQWTPFQPDDPRISFVDANEPTRGIAHWYEQSDVLLALGNEGFGLPLVEGMATGLPVVALNANGQADVCEEAGNLVLPVPPRRWVPFDQPPYGACGVRGVPDVADIAAHLRWVAEHREEARALGRAASAWAHAHRDVWVMGAAILDAMERHLQPRRSLRRLTTVWTPTEGNGNGDSPAAAYAALLAPHLSAARLVRQPPDLRGTRVLHIGYDHTADSADITRYVRQARYGGVPVAVTLHHVTTETAPWEQDADLLISLTEEDAAFLRSRWPTKLIEVVPPADANDLNGGDAWTWSAVARRHQELWRALEAA